MRTSAFSGAKNFNFFLIYGASARTRGVDPVRKFFGQGEGLRGANFSRICAGVFYGGLLRKALYDDNYLCLVESNN